GLAVRSRGGAGAAATASGRAASPPASHRARALPRTDGSGQESARRPAAAGAAQGAGPRRSDGGVRRRGTDPHAAALRQRRISPAMPDVETTITRAPYAADPARSRGRRYPESPPRYRSEFQRDRDRIIHSSAFRRLVYKTQVFVNHEGDLFRTRLTHSLEVAQISRTVARVLGLNEDLAEAISLAHDLGHTPFGHAGQEALNACMQPYGGFEHNLQSLRIVDLLEERYAEFPGLNLTFETREGILKHCSRRNAEQLGELGRRFLERTQPSLEAQLANLADEIAYNAHDIDDGLRAGMLSIEQMRTAPLVGALFEQVERQHPSLPQRRLIYQVVRHLIDRLVTDLIEASRA